PWPGASTRHPLEPVAMFWLPSPTRRGAGGEVSRETSRGHASAHLLQVNRCAAPVFRGDVGDGLRERPDVAAGVHDAVLPLAKGVALRRPRDVRAVLPRALVVAVGVSDPN